MKNLLVFLTAAFLLTTPAFAAGGNIKLPHQDWTFDGHFGTFDRAQLQRGFQVYKEVCAACHGLKYIRYRDLAGIGFNEAEIKALAADALITDGPNDEGEMFDRPGKPFDAIPSPFPNDQAAAAANNGAMPHDLSLMAKARTGGPDYLYALLTGYDEPPEGFEMMPGLYYNRYFEGYQIAMPPPFFDGQVDYADGTEATVSQMSKDVSAFMMWTAEPKLEERKRTGVRVVLFLLILAGLFYASKKRVWAKLKK